MGNSEIFCVEYLLFPAIAVCRRWSLDAKERRILKKWRVRVVVKMFSYRCLFFVSKNLHQRKHSKQPNTARSKTAISDAALPRSSFMRLRTPNRPDAKILRYRLLSQVKVSCCLPLPNLGIVGGNWLFWLSLFHSKSIFHA